MHHLRHPSVLAAISIAAFALIASCGGSSGAGVGGGGPGSALCGPNGTHQCGGRQCDPTLGCVECTVGGTQCAASDPFCVQGACVACRTNADCGAGASSCWPQNHTCH